MTTSTLWLRANVIPVTVFVALFVIWELVCRTGVVQPWLLPAPSNIAIAVWDRRVLMSFHLLVTFTEVLGGFSLAILLGVPIAILITYSDLARKITYPVLLVFQSVPKVALAPLILLWLGYGMSSKIFVAAVTAFFPLVINTTAGLVSTPAEMLELACALKARQFDVFLKVRMPWALPYIVSGMKVAVTLSVIGAVVAEFVGSDTGLGFVILNASSTMNTPVVFGAMVLLSLLGMLFFYSIVGLEKLLCPWYMKAEQGSALQIAGSMS